MAKLKTLEINVKESKGAFSIFRSSNLSKEEYDFSGLLALRQLLSNEKARILNAIKEKKPQSVYELSKLLNRGFKSVNDDIQLLKRFGLIELIKETSKNRVRHRPVIAINEIQINFKV